MAMPWSRAKAKAAAIRADASGKMLADLTRLFRECFRIQREACEAAGRHIPLIVENVKGAQPWVGEARANFGSFYLWGDVPVRQPSFLGGGPRQTLRIGAPALKVPGFHFDGSGRSLQSESVDRLGVKAPGMNWSDQTRRGQDFTRLAGQAAIKNQGGSWFNIGSPGQRETNRNPVHGFPSAGVKGSEGYERDHPEAFGWKKPGTSSKSQKRKFASAMIAKIPPPLAQYIGAVFHPQHLSSRERAA